MSCLVTGTMASRDHVLLELWLGESVVQLHYYGIMYTADCSSTRASDPGKMNNDLFGKASLAYTLTR